MEENNRLVAWSDNWWIEKDKAWFTGGEKNILFCLNLDTCTCEQMVLIPAADTNYTFRLIPRCIKWENDIYCMPDMGNCIWVYNIENRDFSKILIDNPNKTRLYLYEFGFFDQSMLIVSMGLKQVIEIHTKEKKIVKHYDLWKGDELIYTVKSGDCLYSLYECGKVFRFHIDTKQGILLQPPVTGDRFYCFCFDGSSFWLSGYKKEIIVWDYKEDTLEVLDEFPEGVCQNNINQNVYGKKDNGAEQYEIPIFYFAVSVGETIWFIPSLENQIVYADKESHRLNIFEVEEEKDTGDRLLLNKISQKYILEYVKDERYLGLFSTKNYCILEIDTKEMTYQWCKYYYSEKCLNSFAETYENVLWEKDILDKKIYKRRFWNTSKRVYKKNEIRVGAKVYKEIINEL